MEHSLEISKPTSIRPPHELSENQNYIFCVSCKTTPKLTAVGMPFNIPGSRNVTASPEDQVFTCGPIVEYIKRNRSQKISRVLKRLFLEVFVWYLSVVLQLQVLVIAIKEAHLAITSNELILSSDLDYLIIQNSLESNFYIKNSFQFYFTRCLRSILKKTL